MKTVLILIALLGIVGVVSASPVSDAMAKENSNLMGVVNSVAGDLASLGYTSANAKVFLNEYNNVKIELSAPSGISRQGILEGVFAVEKKLSGNAVVRSAFFVYPITVYVNGNIVATGMLSPGGDFGKSDALIAESVVKSMTVFI